MCCPPPPLSGELVPPPRGNPGSATRLPLSFRQKWLTDGQTRLTTLPSALHQGINGAVKNTKRQGQRRDRLCNDASDSVLIENNGVASDWVCNPFSSEYQFSMRKESQASPQHSHSVDADAWRKRGLKSTKNNTQISHICRNVVEVTSVLSAMYTLGNPPDRFLRR